MTTSKPTAALAAALLALAAAPGAHAATAVTAVEAQATCEFSTTLCLWDRTGFTGTRFTASPFPPGTATCVDLVEHGWGERARSAVNTSTRTMALFLTDDCTGHPYPVDAGSSQSELSIAANSAWVQ